MGRAAFLLRPENSLETEAVRLFRAPINHARRALRTPDDDGVHSARKALKRARAVLRLLRPALRRDRYRALDHAVRAAARQLGPTRDAAVALALTDRLGACGDLAPDTAHLLRGYLRAFRDDAQRSLDPNALRAELDGLRLWPEDVSALDVALVAAGVAGTYARGCDRLAEAQGRPSVETLHAWRRQVKHYGYQIRLLVPVWPAVLRCTARAIDDLADVLGDDHDLAELDRHARDAGLPPRGRRAVRAVVEDRRGQTTAAAWPLGARVYADTPDGVDRRLSAFLTLALTEAAEAAPRPDLALVPDLVPEADLAVP